MPTGETGRGACLSFNSLVRCLTELPPLLYRYLHHQRTQSAEPSCVLELTQHDRHLQRAPNEKLRKLAQLTELLRAPDLQPASSARILEDLLRPLLAQVSRSPSAACRALSSSTHPHPHMGRCCPEASGKRREHCVTGKRLSVRTRAATTTLLSRSYVSKTTTRQRERPRGEEDNGLLYSVCQRSPLSTPAVRRQW